MGEEHDSDAGPTVSRGNPRGKPKRNQLETELVGVRGGGPRSKQVSVSVPRHDYTHVALPTEPVPSKNS